MEVKLIDHMGDDLTVVNAARVSFNKESEWEYQAIFDNPKEILSEQDAKLIKYLAKHNHWTPFSHCFATFRIKAPIFVARQLFKHKVGLTENEVSRRYVDEEPEFYYPDVWRKKAEHRKQGSLNIGVSINPKLVSEYIGLTKDMYQGLLDCDICPEQARMVLPQSMYTEWYWSGSMMAFSRVCNLRLQDDAQEETRQIAEMINKECEKLWPVSWTSLQNKNTI